jgi:hypothetical protein
MQIFNFSMLGSCVNVIPPSLGDLHSALILRGRVNSIKTLFNDDGLQK